MITFKLHREYDEAFDLSPLDDFPFPFDPKFGHVFADLHTSQFAMVQIQGDLKGYFPILLKNSRIINTLKFLYNPLSENGMLFNDRQEKEILEKFIVYLSKENLADRILQPINWMLFQSVPYNTAHIPFGTYCLNIESKEEDLWAGLHSKHRNVIRNTEKKDGRIRSGADQLNIFYSLYEATMSRNEMHCEPKNYFKNVMRNYGDHVYCGVIYQGDEAQGGVLVPYTTEGAYYVYGASADTISLTGAINFLHFEAIKFLKEQGVRKYDFVGARLSDISGTKFEGIQKFKKRFGGELKEGYIWKKDINKNKCRLFDLALNVKMKMKGNKLKGDIIDQELVKYK